MAIPIVNMYKRKFGKNYSYVIDYIINGKRIRKHVGKTKRDAEAVKAKIQHELTLGNYDILQKKRIIVTIDELVIEFIDEKKNYIRPKTYDRYTNHFIPFQQFINTYFPNAARDIILIETHHIKECVDYLAEQRSVQKWKAETINRMIQLISSLFIFSIKRKYRTDNPTIDVRKLPVLQKDAPEFFSHKELKEIWEQVDPFWLPVFQFLYYTGIRKGEMINLTWDKVDLDSNPPFIRIVSSSDWKTKTGKARMLHLHKKAIKILKNQIGFHPNYVFISKVGKKVHPNTPYISLKRTLKKLKFTGDVHKLRHTFASHLVMNGANIYDVKVLLGHSKIEMTEKYSHLSPEHKKSVVNLLS